MTTELQHIGITTSGQFDQTVRHSTQLKKKVIDLHQPKEIKFYWVNIMRTFVHNLSQKRTFLTPITSTGKFSTYLNLN